MIREKLQRNVAVVLLGGAMLLCSQYPVHAENNLEYTEEMKMESVSPMYIQSCTCRTYLNFKGRTANCKVAIQGKRGTTKISGLLKLYDNTAGRHVASWTVSKSSSCYSVTKSTAVKKGHSYRLSFSGKVYGKNNKSGEFISSSISKKN